VPGAQEEDKGFLLRPLEQDDPFGSMQSGDQRFAPLKQFVQKRAKKYEQENLARTYVIEDEANNRIAAYVTLVCSEVVSKEKLLNEDGLDFPYDHYPAVKIARLLVDARYRNPNPHGFGKYLVDLSLGIARSEICPSVGCRFVVVDAKAESVKFYEKCGFTLVDTEANRARTEPVMFIDLHKAAK